MRDRIHREPWRNSRDRRYLLGGMVHSTHMRQFAAATVPRSEVMLVRVCEKNLDTLLRSLQHVQPDVFGFVNILSEIKPNEATKKQNQFHTCSSWCDQIHEYDFSNAETQAKIRMTKSHTNESKVKEISSRTRSRIDCFVYSQCSTFSRRPSACVYVSSVHIHPCAPCLRWYRCDCIETSSICASMSRRQLSWLADWLEGTRIAFYTVVHECVATSRALY